MVFLSGALFEGAVMIFEDDAGRAVTELEDEGAVMIFADDPESGGRGAAGSPAELSGVPDGRINLQPRF